MSDVEEFLSHYGVKGMKWGIRRDRSSGGSPRKRNRAARKTTFEAAKKDDSKWARRATSTSAYLDVYNDMARKMNEGEIDRINSLPDFKGKDMSKPGPLQTKYYNTYSKAATKALNDSSKEILGSSKSGRFEMEFDYDISSGGMPSVRLVDKEAEHAEMGSISIDLVRDEKGFIVEMVVTSKTLKQMDAGSEFLEHYGVKGMKWGVRRSAAQLARAAKQNRTSSKAAKKAAQRTRYTSGSKDAPQNLTDAELERRINRMQNEKKYNELNAKTVSSGQKLASEVITNAGRKTATTALSGATMLVVKKAVDKKFGPEASSYVSRGGAKKK